MDVEKFVELLKDPDGREELAYQIYQPYMRLDKVRDYIDYLAPGLILLLEER
jgi:hypothetical protein